MLEKIYNFHEALKQLSIMVNLLPDDKTVWIQRGLVYQEMGNHTLAINDFEMASELAAATIASIKPDDKGDKDEKLLEENNRIASEALFYMAKSKLQAGQIELSIQDFERSELIRPTAAI